MTVKTLQLSIWEQLKHTLLLVLRHSWLILNTRTKPFEQLLTRTFLFLLRYDRRWDLTINATKKRRYIQFVLRACQDVIEKRCLLFADAYEPILHINTHTPWIIIRLAYDYIDRCRRSADEGEMRKWNKYKAGIFVYSFIRIGKPAIHTTLRAYFMHDLICFWLYRRRVPSIAK